MDTLTFGLVVFSVALSFGTLIASLFTLFVGKTFLQRMEERDARWEKRVAELPADVTGARLIELLERHGIRVPPPLPVMTPDEVRARVKGWCAEGVRLADQQRRASPRTTRLDQFSTAKTYVLDQMKRARVELDDRQVGLFIEQAVSDLKRA